MTIALFWEIYKPAPKSLGSRLAMAIWEEYGRDAVLSEKDIPFLKGVYAGADNAETRHGAKELIDALATHGTIRVWITQ
jgi:hypothetical protein